MFNVKIIYINELIEQLETLSAGEISNRVKFEATLLLLKDYLKNNQNIDSNIADIFIRSLESYIVYREASPKMIIVAQQSDEIKNNLMKKISTISASSTLADEKYKNMEASVTNVMHAYLNLQDYSTKH